MSISRGDFFANNELQERQVLADRMHGMACDHDFFYGGRLHRKCANCCYKLKKLEFIDAHNLAHLQAEFQSTDWLDNPFPLDIGEYCRRYEGRTGAGADEARGNWYVYRAYWYARAIKEYPNDPDGELNEINLRFWTSRHESVGIPNSRGLFYDQEYFTRPENQYEEFMLDDDERDDSECVRAFQESTQRY